MSRPTEPQISFADWELLQQGIELEPVLQGISDFWTITPRWSRPYGRIWNEA